MDDSPLFLAQNVSRSIDRVARALTEALTTGYALSAVDVRFLLGIVKDAQRDIAPLAYPKMEVVR